MHNFNPTNFGGEGGGHQPEGSDIYRDISFGVNIEGFRHIVVLVSHCGGKLGTKYCWCCMVLQNFLKYFASIL